MAKKVNRDEGSVFGKIRVRRPVNSPHLADIYQDLPDIVKSASDDLQKHLVSIDSGMSTLKGIPIVDVGAERFALRLGASEKLVDALFLRDLFEQLEDHLREDPAIGEVVLKPICVGDLAARQKLRIYEEDVGRGQRTHQRAINLGENRRRTHEEKEEELSLNHRMVSRFFT